MDRTRCRLPATRAEIAALNGARPSAFTFQFVYARVGIIGIIAWAIHVYTIWASALAILIVATRHNALGLLNHEQAHLLGYRGKYGDLVVDLLFRVRHRCPA